MNLRKKKQDVSNPSTTTSKKILLFFHLQLEAPQSRQERKYPQSIKAVQPNLTTTSILTGPKTILIFKCLS